MYLKLSFFLSFFLLCSVLSHTIKPFSWRGRSLLLLLAGEGGNDRDDGVIGLQVHLLQGVSLQQHLALVDELDLVATCHEEATQHR